MKRVIPHLLPLPSKERKKGIRPLHEEMWKKKELVPFPLMGEVKDESENIIQKSISPFQKGG